MTLRIDKLSAEDAQTLREWLRPIIETVDARVLVTDDADALKTAVQQFSVWVSLSADFAEYAEKTFEIC